MFALFNLGTEDLLSLALIVLLGLALFGTLGGMTYWMIASGSRPVTPAKPERRRSAGDQAAEVKFRSRSTSSVKSWLSLLPGARGR